jgi:hypothetical protein
VELDTQSLSALLGVWNQDERKGALESALRLAQNAGNLILQYGEKIGGGGSRTPVREALLREDYMLSPFRFFRRARSERARRACN